MSWSTSVTAPDGILTDELIQEAFLKVKDNLDQYNEHDTFNAAIAVIRTLTSPDGNRPVIYSFSGHAGSGNRSAHGSYSQQ